MKDLTMAMDKTPFDYFNEGLLAATDCLPIYANPYLFRAWPFNAWEAGWNFRQIQLESELTEDLELERVDKPPFQQGMTAYHKQITISDCPYGPDTGDCVMWQAGWIAAQDKSNSQPNKPVGFYIATIVLIALILWAIIMLTILL